MIQKVMLRKVNSPREPDTRADIEWLCNSLCLIEGRDTQNTSFEILSGLLKLFSREESISTDYLSEYLSIDSARINHHVKNLVDRGIVYREKKRIKLRGGNLTNAIKEIKSHSDNLFEKMIEKSEDIDSKLSL